MKNSKAYLYPCLKALLDASIEAAPNWAKAPGKFVSSLSEQLKNQDEEKNKQLAQEMKGITEDNLREIIKEAGCDQDEDIEFIVGKVNLIPDILQTLNYRFDNVDEKLEEIIKRLSQDKPSIQFPLSHSLHNQTSPEKDFAGRKEMLETITEWYRNPEVRIGALIGWGGVGKSALVRKWYDDMGPNGIKPDGVFWWGFYRNAYLEQFLNALLRYVSRGQLNPNTIKSTWEKTERIKEHIHQGSYLIILDGIEEMQKPETGDGFGKMMHREFAELLHYLADTPNTDSLCLITTRYPLKDIDEWHGRGYENQQLVELSVSDALLMLRKRGVEGSDEDVTIVINRYKGHALSLTLLAGYLKRYYKGDIKHAPEIEFVLGDTKRFEDVNKLLRKYAEKMSDAERTFLNIFSLFRQDVTEDDYAGVFRQALEDTGFNDELAKMDEFDFTDLVNGLAEWRLISYDEINKTYTTHPLIKSYFESDFEEKDKKHCHKRIYQYFGEDAPEKPETLEEMQPLFEQVYHGCAAGLYDEVYDNILWKKIYREEEGYLVRKLGAWETALTLVKTFFPKGNLSQMPLVTNKFNQGWLFNEAGMALKSIGRPKEAEGPSLIGVQMAIEAEEWFNVSGGYQNLADLQFRGGELGAGLESAQKALDASEKARSDKYIRNSKAYLAWILHLTGKDEEADKVFREADELEEKISGNRLYSLPGIFNADFLISMKRIAEAFEITKQNLEICQGQNWTNSISRCHRCLGSIERTKGNRNEAEAHLQDALKIACKVGVPDLEIEALLESGRLHLDTGRHEDAIRDASEVLKICDRTGFKFYEPDAEIVLLHAYAALNDLEQATTFAHSAYEKAIAMHYRWPEGEAAHLLGEIYLSKNDKTTAREWIEKAVACRKEISDPNLEESEKLLGGL